MAHAVIKRKKKVGKEKETETGELHTCIQVTKVQTRHNQAHT